MFSFLGDLFGLLLTCLWGMPQRIVEGLHRAVNGGVVFYCEGLNQSHDSLQQTIASARASVGFQGDRLTWLRSFLRPTPLARVRVPTRRSIR